MNQKLNQRRKAIGPILLALLAIGLVAILLTFARRPPTGSNEADVAGHPDAPPRRETQSKVSVDAPSSSPKELLPNGSGVAMAGDPEQSAVPVLAPEGRELAGLFAVATSTDFRQAPERSRAIAAILQKLSEGGNAAIPTVRDYLARGADVAFAERQTGNPDDETSLRLRVLEGIGAMGTDEARALLLETLQNTAEPREIATISRILESQKPGEYRQLAVAAARDALQMASTPEMHGRHVSALFEVLQAYGDETVVPDLEAALEGKWRFNAALALADLPGGSGIPALRALADETLRSNAPNAELALRPLAQAAAEQPAALEALIEFAQADRLPSANWPSIIAGLAGKDPISNGTNIVAAAQLNVEIQNQLSNRIE